MLLELIAGKACSFKGEFQDASAFCHDGEEVIDYAKKELIKNGFEGYGNEVLYNGRTGKPFKSQIFMGIGYYQRLKHLVSEKMHARGKGDVQLMTRQPCAGRSKDGGLRFGELFFQSRCKNSASVLYSMQHIQIAGTCEKMIFSSTLIY